MNGNQASICDVNSLVISSARHTHFYHLYDSFFSLANSWEEEDEIVLITCRMENPNLDQANGAIKEKLEYISNEL
jgi:carotenoid cleavage dioxygenase